MDAPGERRRFPRPDGRPAIIAHAAGNSRVALADAITAGADYVEVDLWYRSGRFEARHERRVRGLPVLFERWYLRLAPRRPIGIEELLDRTDGGARLFLDLKNGGPEAAELLARAVSAAGLERLVVSSQWWHILREVGRRIPAAVLLYSVDVEAKLQLALSVAERDSLAAGISCRESLLTPQGVARARELGLAVVAWTVDDPERAAELASWGVDGITTHRVSELRSLFDARLEARR
jgi:glycerophosphoryl diester phosphodiesterase